jgi:hypothetical protein
MRKLQFTEPQARHVEVTLRLVDKAVQRVEFVLNHAVHHRGPAGISSTLESETLEKLRPLFRRLQDTAQAFYERYGFRHRKLNLDRVLDAELSSLWEMLENCRPQRMRGYGAMEEHTASQLEVDMSVLLDIVKQARRLLSDPERGHR